MAVANYLNGLQRKFPFLMFENSAPQIFLTSLFITFIRSCSDQSHFMCKTSCSPAFCLQFLNPLCIARYLSGIGREEK